jgi:hypothetical protein
MQAHMDKIMFNPLLKKTVWGKTSQIWGWVSKIIEPKSFNK